MRLLWAQEAGKRFLLSQSTAAPWGNTAPFTAEALGIASLASFPAVVTKIGWHDSMLRMVRYCPRGIFRPPSSEMQGQAAQSATGERLAQEEKA